MLINLAIKLFNGIFGELSENLVETMLTKFLDNGILFHFIDCIEKYTPDDYDYLSYIILFIRRVSVNDKCTEQIIEKDILKK